MFSKANRARWAGVAVAAVGIATPAMAGSAEPSDPSAIVPKVEYRAVLRDYRPPVIVEKPAGWTELNRRAERIGGPGGQLRSPDQPIRARTR